MLHLFFSLLIAKQAELWMWQQENVNQILQKSLFTVRENKMNITHALQMLYEAQTDTQSQMLKVLEVKVYFIS